jgi:hypothetical protein
LEVNLSSNNSSKLNISKDNDIPTVDIKIEDKNITTNLERHEIKILIDKNINVNIDNIQKSPINIEEDSINNNDQKKMDIIDTKRKLSTIFSDEAMLNSSTEQESLRNDVVKKYIHTKTEEKFYEK